MQIFKKTPSSKLRTKRKIQIEELNLQKRPLNPASSQFCSSPESQMENLPDAEEDQTPLLVQFASNVILL